MVKLKKIIFVAQSGTCRAPMAMGLIREALPDCEAEILARGLVVLFPEPLNQKAEAVMISNGIKLEGYMSSPLVEEDFAPDTLIIALNSDLKEKLLTKFPEEENVYLLTDITGDELEIMDPYGGELVSYGLCFESMVKPIRTLAGLLRERQFMLDTDDTAVEKEIYREISTKEIEKNGKDE